MASTVTGICPHLLVEDARVASEFYERAFGAIEIFRNVLPDGRVLFVELAVGVGRLLLSESFPEVGADASGSRPHLPLLLHVEVEDPDDVVRRAALLGATVEQPVSERFWGERYGVVRDPFRFRWSVSTARQSLTFDEVSNRTPASQFDRDAPTST